MDVSKETGQQITMTQVICHILCDQFKIPREPDENFRARRKNVIVRKVSPEKEKLTEKEAQLFDQYMSFKDKPELQKKMLDSPIGPVIKLAHAKLGLKP